MRGMQINLRHLKAFVEVCKHRGISAAAGHIHLSQPAITQAISKLEDMLGSKLFIRSSKGMYPTDPAKVFLKRSEEALNILKAGAREAARKRRVGLPHSFVDVITSTQLRALIAVAQHGNFSVAARAEGMSQPALYRMARDLESVCHIPLYNKTQHGFELTPSALILVRAAKLAFSELDQGIEEFKLLHGIDESSLTIGSLPLARSTILPTAINRLTEERPNVRIKVTDSPYNDLLHALRHGDIDIMIGALRDPAPAPDVEQKPLFSDQLGIFCGPRHPLLGKADVTLDDLTKYSWIAPPSSAPTRKYFDKFFAGVGSPNANRLIETSSMILIRGLLQGSDRLTMISAKQVRDDVRHGTLVPLPVTLSDAPRLIGLTYRQNWTPTSTQSRFIDMLTQVSGEFDDMA